MNHNHLAALRFSVIAMSIHADAADIKSKWTMMNLKRLYTAHVLGRKVVSHAHAAQGINLPFVM